MNHCINACSDESLRYAVLEDSPNPMLYLAFCVPGALRFIPLGYLFSDF